MNSTTQWMRGITRNPYHQLLVTGTFIPQHAEVWLGRPVVCTRLQYPLVHICSQIGIQRLHVTSPVKDKVTNGTAVVLPRNCPVIADIA